MSFLKKISPFYTPGYAAQKGGLFSLREKILQAMLIVFAILGIPTVGLASIDGIRAQDWFLPLVYITIYFLFLAMMLLRSLPYRLRGFTLVLVVFLLALSELFESGQMGDVRMFLIVFTSLVAVLFDFRPVIASIGLSLVTIAAAGIYAASTTSPILPAFVTLRQGTDWLTSSMTFLMIASILSGSITLIISGLGTNLAKQAELSQALGRERDALDERIQERTRSMARQMAQLHAAAEISRAISALSDPDTLLQQVVDLVKERFGLYYAGIFLLDSSGAYAILRAGTGEEGRQMLAQGHQLFVGGASMIGWSISNRKPRIALDTGLEAVRFNNPNLPETRSELALPVIARDAVLGAITIQSEKPNAFDENDIAVLENIADGLAIALENDRLYHETRQGLEEIRVLNHEYLQRRWAETIQSYGELTYDFENPLPGQESQPASAIEVPLVLRNEVIGTINLEMDRAGLTADETAFIENVTTQTAIALENARLLHDSDRRAVQEQKMNELASRFSRAQTIDEILRAAAQELGQLPAVADVSVQLNLAGLTHGLPGNGNGKEQGA